MLDTVPMMQPTDGPGPEWRVSDTLVAFPDAVAAMQARAAAIADGAAREAIWLLEHPPLYTAGTSADPAELLVPDRFPVFQTGRGGRFTYHGPGQRVGYCMLDLTRRGRDVRRFVQTMEAWIIAALAEFNLRGEIREGRVGVWIDLGGGVEKKIAAIGVRLRRWVSFHGFSINVDPDLEHFAGIVPCGIDADAYGVTSLVDLGLPVTLHDVDLALARTFPQAFEAAHPDAA